MSSPPVRRYGRRITTNQIFVGLGLTVLLAVACQIGAARLKVPAIVLLLPVGFVGGHYVEALDGSKTLGAAFSPLVGLAVAVILFDSGLDLELRQLEGHNQRVLRRLLGLGIPITWIGATALSLALLDVSRAAAVMLGAIVIVSGPTVVAPLLEAARPGRRVTHILGWEGATIDPFGAIIGALVFQALVNDVHVSGGAAAGAFARSIAVGVAGGAVATLALWLALDRLRLRGELATEAVLAVVVGTAAICDAVRDDTGLIAAIVAGVAVANIPGIDLPEDRRFFRTVVQLVIGVLFVSISAAVTFESVESVLWPALGVVVGLVLLVRPFVAAVSTVGTSLTWRERVFVGWMHPRGIVAASTAAGFGAQLVDTGIPGADLLVPVTFVVIMATVTIYGLTALPLARRLALVDTGDDLPEEPVPPGLGPEAA